MAALTLPTCPRCGYDLSGETVRWVEECPTTGTCPECGVQVEWRELLSERFRSFIDLYETAGTRRARAFRRTLLKAVRPFRFWSWVRMVHPIDPVRALVAGIAGALLVHILCVILIASVVLVCYFVALLMGAPGVSAGDVTPPLWRAAWPLFDARSAPFALAFPSTSAGWYSFNSGSPAQSVVRVQGIGILAALLMPAAVLLLPATLAGAKVRRMHLWRIGCYSLISIPMLLVCVSAVFLLPMCIDYVISVGLANTAPPPSAGWFSFWNEVEEFNYSCERSLRRHGWLIPAILLPAWLWLWWGSACSRYLKLPRAWSIAFFLTLLSWLAALLTLVVLTQGRFLTHLFNW